MRRAAGGAVEREERTAVRRGSGAGRDVLLPTAVRRSLADAFARRGHVLHQPRLADRPGVGSRGGSSVRGPRCARLPELSVGVRRGGGRAPGADGRSPAGAPARPGAQPAGGAALGLHGVGRGRAAAVRRRGDRRHEPGGPLHRAYLAVQHRQARRRAAAERGAKPRVGPGDADRARLHPLAGRAGAHRRVVRRRPLPAAPALRVERRRRPALPPPRADLRRGGSGRRADVRAPAGSAADPRGHPSDRRRPRHDARRAPPARSRRAAARPLPPDAHPHRHRPAPAFGRSRVGGRSLQPAEPVLSASAGRALHHGAGRPHPAHRRPLGRGDRVPGAADGRIDEGRRTNDGGAPSPDHAPASSFQSSRPPTPPALSSWRPPSRRSMPSIRRRARPSCWPTGCGWASG